jgi:hypothetical protein
VLSLRVLRGSGATTLLRWLLVAAASCGTGVLLLAALGWALAHPQGGASDAVIRLGWCVVPVVATVQLAVAVGRTQPAGWPRSGLAAVGLGRAGLVLLSAATAAVVCALGSGVALVLFLQLRGDVAGAPFGGIGPGVLAAGRKLPLAGAVTLLALVPAAAAAASAARLRTERAAPTGTPGGLPWGIALVAIGMAIEVAAPHGHAVPLPSGLGSIPPAAAGGWIVTTAGLMLAGPGLVDACGRLLAAYRPGAVRLLAGRGLQQEARRLGRPLGLLAATAAAAFSVWGLRQDAGHHLGPLTTFAAALVAVCVLGTASMAALDAHHTRAPAIAALRDLAASPALLRTAATVRATVLLAGFLPPAVLIAALSPLP